jgi:hypothetical protein
LQSENIERINAMIHFTLKSLLNGEQHLSECVVLYLATSKLDYSAKKLAEK